MIRLLQARALLLDHIRDYLRDRSVEELQEIERTELRRLNSAGAMIAAGGSAQEQWLITLVGGEYLLVSRRGRSISDEQRRQIATSLGVRATED